MNNQKKCVNFHSYFPKLEMDGIKAKTTIIIN